MKKLVILILLVSLVMMSAPAFAKGDGGFFTKWLDGMLGDSWEEGTTDTSTSPAPASSCTK